jgi:hypothetical protein
VLEAIDIVEAEEFRDMVTAALARAKRNRIGFA